MKYIVLTLGILLAAQFPAAFAADAANKPTAPKAAAKSGFSGKVAETMNAASYTYVLVETASGKKWAAAPQFSVKVGDTVAIGDPMEMRNYHSKTLNRDFDVVFFTGSVTVNGKAPVGVASTPPTGSSTAQLPQGHPPIGGNAANPKMPAGHPDVSGASARTSIDFAGIKKAQGGKTVAEIYAGKAKLAGQQTSVRGKVVKYNEMIMGKNWVHIQDGTGAVGSNDLLVTTADKVKVGDTVLVKGKVATDKDFGANYKYAILIEEAKIVVE
jgi:hypothetical protein